MMEQQQEFMLEMRDKNFFASAGQKIFLVLIYFLLIPLLLLYRT
jgi:hypothetical protein